MLEHPDPDSDPDPARWLADAPEYVLPTRLRSRAATDAERTFIVETDGPRITYGEFDSRVGQWCRLLSQERIETGERIASALPASIDAQALWMAIAGMGGCEVPINPDLPGPVLRYQLEDAQVRLCFIRPEHRDTFDGLGIAGLRIVEVPRSDGPADGLEPLEPSHNALASDIASVIYTSGTTGSPKGVLVPWGQFTSIIGRVPRRSLGPDDVTYAPWPMFHVTGRSPIVIMADVAGSVVIRERFSLGAFWDDLRRFSVTTTTVGPVMRLLLCEPPTPNDRDHCLRHVMGGVQDRHALEFSERFGVKVIGAYGSTEIGFPIVHPGISADSVGITGWLRSGYEARIIDDAGRDVPDGQIGELLIRPPSPTMRLRGYLGLPDLDERILTDDWYHTRDLFRREVSGALSFVDRVGDTIRRFGENISASATQSVIAADPEVRECAVAGLADEIGGAVVFAVVVARDLDRFDPAALFERLGDVLAPYALPARIAVVDELPKTPNGKIRSAELLPLAADAWVSPAAIRHR